MDQIVKIEIFISRAEEECERLVVAINSPWVLETLPGIHHTEAAAGRPDSLVSVRDPRGDGDQQGQQRRGLVKMVRAALVSTGQDGQRRTDQDGQGRAGHHWSRWPGQDWSRWSGQDWSSLCKMTNPRLQ